MEKFFTTFPNLRKFFDESAEFGMKNHYIIGLAPADRVRFFHTPSNDGEVQAIGRQAKNFKIQEASATILKIALIKLRRYIITHVFPAMLHLPVHDEILSSCHKTRSKEWVKIQERAMEEAADMFLEKGLLKVDTDILERWTKN